MSDINIVDAASKRLSLALDALEAAADRRHEADSAREALAEQVHSLGIDRSRLASELDHAAARAKTLESANREMARRLDGAIETIQGVLEANDR